MSDAGNKSIDLYTPNQLGWLRRPDKDTRWNVVWEKPDGKLVHVMRGISKVLVPKERKR